MSDKSKVSITHLRPAPVIDFDPARDDGLPRWNYQIVQVLHGLPPEAADVERTAGLLAAAGQPAQAGDIVCISSSQAVCAYEYHHGAWEELPYFDRAREDEEAA